MKFDLEAILAEKEKREAAIEPVDIAVLVGDKAAIVRLPFLRGDALEDLLGRHSPHVAFQDSLGCWFDLAAVVREHPDIILTIGGEQTNLLSTRDGEEVYEWPAVYDALSPSDKQSVQAVFWGFHVHDPRQLLARLQAEEAAA